ncbi:MAG: WbqC-like family protein [Bacteroidota bacterium]|nr:WbqC-like family protein [Bacteroidota bacterium]
MIHYYLHGVKTILIESQYIGSCSYWKELLRSEKIYLDRHEHFVKRSYRNRAHILGANGLLRLSIPLESGKHQHSAMKDVRISYNENWQKIHWQSLTSTYRRSPFFEFYEDHLRKMYETQYELLFEYNYNFMQVITGLLKINLPVTETDKYIAAVDDNIKDYRNYFLPGKEPGNDFTVYPQVFSDRFEFIPDLCVLDLLFNMGTRSLDYLSAVKY